MNKNQRKAQLKRAQQHQEYCKSRKYKVRKHVRWQADWNRFNRDYAQFERETYAEWNAENRLTLKRVSILILSWLVAVLGVAWIAERLV